MGNIQNMSEARYNDLVYVTLKRFYFEPMLGEGHGPRECDIRVCMQMGHKPLLAEAGPSAAILMPDEKSSASHDRFFDIDTEVVFDEIVTYMEDHWLKSTTAEAFKVEGIVEDFREDYRKMIPVIMDLPEEQCGPNGVHP
jgi:hypothetical protein